MFSYSAFETLLIVTGAATAVREELVVAGCGDVNRFCPVVPGEVVWDTCDCGQLAQTITSVTPSNTFPAPALDARTTPCGPQQVVVSVTLSLTRCVPVLDDNGQAPSCDALGAAALCLEQDRVSVRHGVTCYLRDRRDAYEITDFVVGAATSVGPQGGCAGVELAYSFGLANVCCG